MNADTSLEWLHPVSAADGTLLYVIFVFLQNALSTVFTKDIPLNFTYTVYLCFSYIAQRKRPIVSINGVN
jgi:hypothetical protein